MAAACLAMTLVASPSASHAQMGAALACMTRGKCPTEQQADPLQRDGFALRLATISRFEQMSAILPGQSPGVPPNGKTTTEDMRQLEQRLKGDGALRDSPSALVSIGNGFLLEGRFDQAKERYLSALRLSDKGRDRQSEAAATANLGVLAAAQGRYTEAREQLELGLTQYESLKDRPSPPSGALTAADLAQNAAKAGLDPRSYDQAAAFGPLVAMQLQFEANAAVGGALRTRLNLANLAGQMGRYAEAEAALRQVLDRLSPAEQQVSARVVLAELVVLYRQAGRPEDAASFRKRAEASPAAAPTQSATMMDGGLVALGGAAAPQAQSRTEEAERLRPSHYAEAAQARMLAEAQEREKAADAPGAINAYSRAALLAAVVAAPERQRSALAQLERLHGAGGSTDAAIFYGKRAVNVAQRLRAELGALDRQARQAYLADKKLSYAALARLLLQQDRLAEAEQVLRLLKEDEGQQFRQTLGPEARGAIPYTSAEAGALAPYDALAERNRQLEARRTALQEQGMFGNGGDSRVEQEKFRRAQLGQIDPSRRYLDATLEKLAPRVERARSIARKPATSRSAEENRFLGEYRLVVRFLDDHLANMAAAVRTLRRDARFFLTPLSADESSRADALEAQIAQQRQRFAQMTALPTQEPEPKAPELSQMPAMLLDFGKDKMQQFWAIDREIEELDGQRERLDAALAETLARGRPVTERSFAAADAAMIDAGRRVIAALPAGTAALYYLAGDEQLDILLVQRDGRRAFRVPLARAQLEERIRAFRQVLQNPRADPAGPAKQLYDSLVAPVEKALQEAGTTTLMLALDGQLRYLPFAALHDGQGWLAERYATDLYTTAAPAALAAVPSAKWRAAAFGSTAGAEGFAPLPAVRSEVEGVVRDSALRTQGVLPGVIRLDQRFTAAALRTALRDKPSVVHIASHFAFRGGDPNASFLLLGDGGRLTLTDLATADYRFDQVDLVTLSACETALSGSDSFGQEVEGMGTLLQGQGASAVLATLWSVADDSTAQFMRTLYTLREQRKLTRAQAVREAQLTLLRGGGGAAAGGVQRGASRLVADPGPAGWRADPARPYGHPYFWAPFVLMGNWL